jgi:hypothetical protein
MISNIVFNIVRLIKEFTSRRWTEKLYRSLKVQSEEMGRKWDDVCKALESLSAACPGMVCPPGQGRLPLGRFYKL